jgi:hypothetical protein
MGRKPIQIFLVIAISLSIFGSSTYRQYYTLASADFISTDLKIENFDEDYLFVANQSEFKVFELDAFFKDFHLLKCLNGQSFHLFSQKRSLDQKTSVLRC